MLLAQLTPSAEDRFLALTVRSWGRSLRPASGRTVAFVSNLGGPLLSVVCEPCGRRERHDVERLARQYGWDAKLTDLLPALVADCPKKGSVSVYDRCKAVFERRG